MFVLRNNFVKKVIGLTIDTIKSQNINAVRFISNNCYYEDQEEQFIEDKAYKELANYIFEIPGTGHNIFVVQPRIKWGPGQNKLTNAQLQLEEAVTLVKTLEWKVTGSLVTTVKDARKLQFFSSTAIEKIKSDIAKTRNTTAIFISVNMMRGLQHRVMQEEFKLPVYDRYTIVLQIFSEHANTKEAKIQIALAEIPYLKSRLRTFHEQGTHGRDSGKMQFLGGSGETFISKRKELLAQREIKLKKMLAKLREKRQLLRQNRQKKEIPVVAVVGYTNAGKTTLIKSITEDESMEPKNVLFATLDVTTHAGILSNYQKALFIDTIGFISDIPVDLVESFSATLEDVALADLIVHIRDLSHPDTVMQKETVLTTLKQLNLSEKLMDSVIEVGNKIDLIEGQINESENENCYLISAKSGYGVGDLRKVIQENLIKNKDLLFQQFKVPMGGEAARWLYKFSSVSKAEADEDVNYLLVDCIISKANLSKFKHLYGNDFIN